MLNQYRYQVGQFQIGMNTFKLRGADTQKFLQAQTTSQVNSLGKGDFQLTSLLDPHGKVEAYGWPLKVSEQEFLFLVPEKLKDVTRERLDRFLISEDVVIEGPFWEDWTVLIGPERESYKTDTCFSGEIFGEKALLLSQELQDVPTVSDEDVELWQLLSGSPSFDGHDFKPDLINNLRLFDLSVSLNKGCYTGQETVSKIATRRGAAYAPVLIKVQEKLVPGTLTNFEKKIGESNHCIEWHGQYYLTASLLRDFRVEGMKFNFTLHGREYSGEVRYYPLISGNEEDKAKELFYEATEHFKKDDLETAEECLKRSIRLDPHFADSYESLGVMLGRMGRYDEAIQWMEALAKVDPTSVLAHTNMSLFLMKQGKIQEAEEQKSLATVKSFQKFGEEARLKEQNEKAKKEKESDWAKREAMFIQVLEIDAEDTLANYGLGALALERGNWEKATQHLEKVLKADPQYSVAYLSLGRAYKALGKKSEAKSTWETGIKVAAKKGDLMPANQMQSELEQL